MWGPVMCQESLPERIAGVVFCTSVWLAMYKLQQLIPSQPSAEWRCRVVTMVHGVLITALSIYSQCIEGPDIFHTAPGLGNNNTQMTIAKLCFGYFIFDMAWCLSYQTEHPVMLLHHILSLFGLFCSTIASQWGTELVAVIAYTELTNPLLQSRWFLKTLGLGDRWYAVLIDWAFIVSFGVCRLLLGSVMLYSYMASDRPDFLGRFGGCCIYALSWVFYYFILRYAYKKYFVRQSHNKDTKRDSRKINNTSSNSTTVNASSKLTYTLTKPSTICTSTHLKAE